MATTTTVKHFRDWTLSDALAALDARIEADLGPGDPETLRASAVPSMTGREAYHANRLLIEHRNHWQGGRLWPVRYPAEDVARRFLPLIERMFAPRRVVNSAVKRLEDALMGTEATIGFAPVTPLAEPAPNADEATRSAYAAALATQQRETAAMHEAFASQWDAWSLWKLMRRTIPRAAYATRGPARARLLPSALLPPPPDAPAGTGPRTVSGLAFADALARVSLSTPLPHQALLYTDPDTEERCAIIRIADEDGQAAAELWFVGEVEGAGGQRVPATIRRRLHQGDAPVDYPLPPGTPLPLVEVDGELLIDDPVRRAQMQLNFTSTKLTRVVQTASDRERYGVGVEEPGVWSLTPPPAGTLAKTATDAHGNTVYFYPGPFETGPETVTLVSPQVLTEGNAAEGPQFATPSVVIAPPVDPEYLTKAADAEEAALLRSLWQGHTVTSSKATSGDEKREQRADFAKLVGSYRVEVETETANLLTIAARMALLLTSPADPMHDLMDRYRIVCTLHPDTGPLSADEGRFEVELAEKGFKPRADVMASVGRVEDVGAADAMMAADPVQRVGREKALLEAAALIRADYNEAAAVQYLRDRALTPAVLELMAQSDIPTTIDQ